MKTYTYRNNYRRNSQAVSQWLAAGIIIVVILLAMFAIIYMSNEPANEPYKPVVSTSVSDLPSTSNSLLISTTTTTTTTASETTTTTTTTTTAPTTTTTTAVSNQQKCKITAEYANVRSGPGAGYEYVQKVYSGESYAVIGQDNASNGILWYKIDLGGGKTGYVCGAFVDFSGTVSTTVNNSRVEGGKAYLTFDDGPSSNTVKILDILDRYGVKATFFVIYHKNQEDTYRAIVERGHTLALHSYSHDYEDIYSSRTAFFNDLDKLSDYVSGLTGVTPLITRFPGGSSNTISKRYCAGIMTELTQAVESRGYSYFDWNIDSGDADDTTVDKDKIVENVKRRTGSYKNAFILMHDAKAKTTTVEALPEIIEYLQSRGYEILPITTSTPPMHHKVNN